MLEKIHKRRLLFSYIAALAPILYAFQTHPHLIHYALIIIALGVSTRLWAAGYISKNEVLSQEGPYALTRNPLYLGTFLSGVGLFILVRGWLLLALFLPLFGLFYGVTIGAEQRFLRSKYGGDYDAYCRRVPIFFPKIIPAKTSEGTTFSIRQAILQNNEIVSIACTALEVGLVYLSLLFP